MLKLIQIIPCERVIIDETGVVSTIGIMEVAEVATPPETPTKFIMPMRWSVVTLWRREQEVEAPVEYEQRIIIRTPEQDQALSATTTLQVDNHHLNFRTVVRFGGFPFSTTGVVSIEVHLRQKGTEEWDLRFTYPMNVIRTIKEAEVKDEIEVRHEI